MEKVSEYYPWNDEHDSSEFIVHFDNNSGSGEFSFVYSLLKLLKIGVTVRLICTNHDRSHYESILRKSNMDINRLEASGKLTICMLCSDSLISLGSTTNRIGWSELSARVTGKANGTSRTAIMVDDLDALELLAPSSADARRFISTCLRLLNSTEWLANVIAYGRLPLDTLTQFNSLNGGEANTVRYRQPSSQSSTAASRHNYPLDENHQPSLCEYVKYRADVIVIVSPLESGYSSAVHGIVSVIRQQQQQSSSGGRRQINLQFKALDSGVICSPVGGSSSSSQSVM